MQLPSGRSAAIDLLVPPVLAGVDAASPPGPLAAAMLPRAHAALAGWKPGRGHRDSTAQRLRAARELRRGEREPDAADRRPGRAGTSEAEVSRLVAAEQRARELARSSSAPPTLDVIRVLHALVVGTSEPWRTDVVWLGDADGPDPRMRIQPAAPERIDPAMVDLERLLQRPATDPIIVAALAFAQLPAIHPWRDGNGRTGRLLTQLLIGASIDADGDAPDVVGELAKFWGDTSVVLDSWLADGALDEWIALFCGAVVAAAGSTPRRFGMFRSKRR